MRTDIIRGEIRRMLKQSPFRAFVLNLENGDKITIEHPENIAFDPGINGTASGSQDFYVISRALRFFGSFEAVSGIVLLEQEGETDVEAQ